MVTFAPPVRRVRVPVARPQDYLRPGGQPSTAHDGYVETVEYGVVEHEVVEYNDNWYTTTAMTYYPTVTYTGTYATTTMTGDQWLRPIMNNTTTATADAAFNPQVWRYWIDELQAATGPFAEAMRRTGVQVAELGEVTREQREALAKATREQREALERQREEARDAAQRRREEASRLRLAEQERQRGAQERASELFAMLLTPEELASWEAQRRALVRVRGQGNTLFLIETTNSVHGNVTETDEHGCRLGNVCVAPDMYDTGVDTYLPLADGWIGQLMAIRHDLEHFRNRGNWSRRQECGRRVAAVPLAA